MAPERAAQMFMARYPGDAPIHVTLLGALAATGRGHLTDVAIRETLGSRLAGIEWEPQTMPSRHPNGMRFETVPHPGGAVESWTVYSIGGGALADDHDLNEGAGAVYPIRFMSELLEWCRQNGKPFWAFVQQLEADDIFDQLERRWQTMWRAMQAGLAAEGILPGGLQLERRARSFNRRALRNSSGAAASRARVSAYALAVSEQNASGGTIVTAPTCGACGVVPAVIREVVEALHLDTQEIPKALATAGIIGNFVKINASISGAEVGCQGEIGTACAMAAGAAAWMMGGTPEQVEYAAEMGIEHHLGLTCDPVNGLVQIPCIERNAFAAMRALDAAEYALLSDGKHRISFDEVTAVLRDTGRDLGAAYRETAQGGLAANWVTRKR